MAKATNSTDYQIVHVTSAHPASDGRIFYKEASSAANFGFRTAVVGPHPYSETLNGVDIIPINRNTVPLLRRALGPIEILRTIWKLKPRIVHFHDPEIIPVGYLLKLLGFKVVYDVHEYYSEIQALRVPAGPVRVLARKILSLLLEQMPCKIFDRSVFPTNRLRLAVAPGPRSISLVNLLPKAQLHREGIAVEKVFDIVFMGTISPFRAGPLMEMLSYILESRPETKLLMLGVGEATKIWMQENAISSNVLNAITFHSRVPHDQVFEILAKSRVGFNYHPMEKRFEVAIPTKVYEYMACGLPVVCTSFPELSDQFEGGKEIVMVEGDDQREYASAVLEILNDVEKSKRIGEGGLLAVSTRINWDISEAPKIRHLYNELLYSNDASNVS